MNRLAEMSEYLQRHGYDHAIEFGAAYVSDDRTGKVVRLENLRAAVIFVLYG